MNSTVEKCLADLENRIDESQEQRVAEAWRDFADGKLSDGIFTPPGRQPAPPGIEWPEVHINDAQNDFDLMLLSELRGVSGVLEGGGGAILNVRCNYGVGILASGFGCQVIEMPRGQHNLPTTIPLESTDAIKAALAGGVPDPRAGLGDKVFRMGEHYLRAFEPYPKVRRHVQIYHPDLQGPIDNAELIWGSELFYAFYDEADMLREFLDLMVAHYIAFMKRWQQIVPPVSPYSPHWGLLHRGQLLIRNDSLMNLSGEIYAEFVRPLDQQLFDAFGGEGAIHFCGRGSHFIEAMSEMRGLNAVNVSQPELNDMECVFRNTVDKGINLIGFQRAAAESANRPLRGRVHCY